MIKDREAGKLDHSDGQIVFRHGTAAMVRTGSIISINRPRPDSLRVPPLLLNWNQTSWVLSPNDLVWLASKDPKQNKLACCKYPDRTIYEDA